MKPILHVTAARYLEGYRVWLAFDDGTSGEADLESALNGPVFEPLRNPAVFRGFQFDPDLDTIAWPNGADLAPEFLQGLVNCFDKRMDYDEAVRLILSHGIGGDGITTQWTGFIGSLRPFSGLREGNFLELMDAIAALSMTWQSVQSIDRHLARGLFGLTTTARCWGLDPGGMLQSNKLLTPDETELLRLWVICLEIAIDRALANRDPRAAMNLYHDRRNVGS